MASRVDIAFECLPLRNVTQRDVPVDASTENQERCRRIVHAIELHGTYNSYYLYEGHCTYHLTNDPQTGLLGFRFEGTVLTDPLDRTAVVADLQVELHEDTCEWLVGAVAEWFHETVMQAVMIEFDRYIGAGDLQKTVARLAKIEAECIASGGFIGWGL
jgi:hypothetical protein